jgi:Zn-dependent M28 family amino/carboxypeptidase
MYKLSLIIAVTVLTSCHPMSKITLDQIKVEQNSKETKDIITILASDEFEGRKPGEKGFEKAAQYVESFLSKNNVKPYFKTYKDSLDVNGKLSYNVVGFIGEKKIGKKYILLGAHLDHLGKARNGDDLVYNGANDDASGVTAVMQIAKYLSKQQFEQNIIVALFTGEESGLIGSGHLAEVLKSENIDLSYMLNFEMIGKTLTTGKNEVYITGYQLSDAADKINTISGAKFIKYLEAEHSQNLFYRSDNYSFYKQFKVPCHTLSSFDFENYNYYHSPKDEIKELDIDNMHDIINTSTYIIQKMLKNNTKLKMKKFEARE